MRTTALTRLRWSASSAAAPSDYDLAVEICRCQRLIKGYGDTHARGMKSFTAIMDALDTIGADDNGRYGPRVA